MKKKKIISYRDDRIKKIARTLRLLIRDAVLDEDSRLGDLRSISKRSDYKIQQQREQLLGELDKSICMCSRCRKSDRDMVFNPFLEEWWCTQCYQEMSDFYYKQPSFFNNEHEEEYYKTFTL